MQPLNILRKSWKNGVVHFEWDAAENNNRYVYAIALTGTLEPCFDGSCWNEKDISRTRDARDASSIDIKIGRSKAVAKRQFILFSSAEALDVRALYNKPLSVQWRPYIGSATIGHTRVRYWQKKGKAVDALEVSFVLKSDADIDEGVLGYRYMCGDTEMRLPFPERIVGGNRKNRSKSILVPVGCNVTIVPLEQSCDGSVEIQKGSFIGGLF